MEDVTTVKLTREEQLELQLAVEKSTRLSLQAQQLMQEAERLRIELKDKSDKALKTYVPADCNPVSFDLEKGEIQYIKKQQEE